MLLTYQRCERCVGFLPEDSILETKFHLFTDSIQTPKWLSKSLAETIDSQVIHSKRHTGLHIG